MVYVFQKEKEKRNEQGGMADTHHHPSTDAQPLLPSTRHGADFHYASQLLIDLTSRTKDGRVLCEHHHPQSSRPSSPMKKLINDQGTILNQVSTSRMPTQHTAKKIWPFEHNCKQHCKHEFLLMTIFSGDVL